MKILVIDDEYEILELLKIKLSAKKHQVYTASCGEEGIVMAGKFKPDLILLDVVMPGMDGVEVCGKLKASRKTKGIPVFMLSAMSQVYYIDEAFKQGADDYIMKPFKAAGLTDTIQEKFELYWKKNKKN